MKIFQIEEWQKRYFILSIGQGISSFSSSIVQMALIWYITDKTKSAAILSIATLIGYVPQAVLGLFIGALIDRYDRKKIMILSDIGIASACAVLIVTSFITEIPIAMILFVLGVRSIGNAFFEPSMQAVIPLIVPKDRLTQYAGYSQTFSSLAFMLSPAVAGILYGMLRLRYILFLDIAGAFISVITLIITYIPKLSGKAKEGHISIFSDIIDGYMEMKRVSGMWALMLVGTLYAIIYFPIGTLYPFISLTYFNMGVEGSGLVESIFSIGSLLGSVLLGIFGDKIPKARFLSISIFIYGAGCLLIGMLAPSRIIWFVMLSLMMGLSTPLYFGIETAILQTKIAEEYLGRVLSFSSSISMLAMPLGMVLSGIWVDIIGINVWFFICGIFTLLLSILPITLPNLKEYT